MADNKSSSGKNSGKNVSANISGKTEISVTNNVVNNNSSKVNTSSASASAVSSKESKESNRVDTGYTSSLTRRELKQFSDTLSEVLSNNKSKDNYNEFESLIKGLKENNELFNNAMTKKNDESSNPNKTEKTPEERDAEKAQKATDAAVAALIELDESLNNKTSVLSDTAKAAAHAAGSSLKEGNAHKAMAVSALSAINPMLGTVTQMLLSDTVGKYTSKFFGSMFAFGQSKVAQAQHETELRDKVIEALNKSAVNVEELMEKTAELKNIDVQKLLEAKRNANIPEEFGGSKKNSTLSDAAKEGITANDIKESTVKQEGFLSKISTGIGSLAAAIMPKKKTGAEEAHEASEKKDMFGRIKATVGKGISKGANIISSLFSAIKKAFISSLGFLALYFSSDQFKAWLRGWITAPFKRIGDVIKKWWDDFSGLFIGISEEVKKWWNGEKGWKDALNGVASTISDWWKKGTGITDILKSVFENLGSITKVAAGVLLGLKLVFGKFFPLGSILKLGAVGVVKALKGVFSLASGLVKKLFSKGAEKVAAKGAEKVAEKAVAEGAEKVAEKVAAKGVEKVAEKAVAEGAEKVAEKVAAKGVEKVAEKAVAEGVEKVAEKVAVEGAEKVIAKDVAKVGAKAAGKTAAKKSPLGLLAGAYFAYDRFNEGDYLGSGLELLSGALGSAGFLSAGLGTALSFGVDAMLAARDIKKATSEVKAEGKEKQQKVLAEKKEIANIETSDIAKNGIISTLEIDNKATTTASVLNINKDPRTVDMISNASINNKKDDVIKTMTLNDIAIKFDQLIGAVERQRTAIVNNSNISSTLAFNGR